MEEQKFYLTKPGLERIQKERDKLVEFKRLKTKDDVPSIWHSEDVNPEYLAFQEDMTLLETKLAEYENILKNQEIIKLPPKERRNELFLGGTVTLEDEDGSMNEYTIVGTLEANPAEGKISSDSPVGRALLGKKVNEEAIITSPIRVVYKIRKIKYSLFSS